MTEKSATEDRACLFTRVHEICNKPNVPLLFVCLAVAQGTPFVTPQSKQTETPEHTHRYAWNMCVCVCVCVCVCMCVFSACEDKPSRTQHQ